MTELLKWSVYAARGAKERTAGKGSIGLDVGKDRDSHFVRDQQIVHLHLLDAKVHELVIIDLNEQLSFWKDCPELTDAKIKSWLERRRGNLVWPEGSPPKVLVWPLGQQCFAVLGIEEPSNACPESPTVRTA
jgi:hypothetical protein